MTDLATQINAVIRQCRVPDRAGEAVVTMLSETHVLVPRDGLRKVLAERIGWGCVHARSFGEIADDVISLLADLARDAPAGTDGH